MVVGHDPSTTNEEITAKLLRGVCGVKSRAELDHDSVSAATFDCYIRKPYMEHLQSGNRFVA